MYLEETLRCAPEPEDLCAEGEGASLASEFWGWGRGICLVWLESSCQTYTSESIDSGSWAGDEEEDFCRTES